MIARFPGRCTCGCGRPFAAGEEVQRAAIGWVRSACRAPAARPPDATYYAGPETIREVLAHARRVAAREATPAGGRR